MQIGDVPEVPWIKIETVELILDGLFQDTFQVAILMQEGYSGAASHLTVHEPL